MRELEKMTRIAKYESAFFFRCTASLIACIENFSKGEFAEIWPVTSCPCVPIFLNVRTQKFSDLDHT